MPSCQKTFNHQNPIFDTNKNDIVNPNKEKNNNETKEVAVQFREMKIPEPIIFVLDKNKENSLLADNNNTTSKNNQGHITKDAKEIVGYYLEYHKNMIITYDSIYSQIMHNNSGLSWNIFLVKLKDLQIIHLMILKI